jgi:hypothetical protein
LLDKIEKISKILNESYSEKSLLHALEDFFTHNFGVESFYIEINGQKHEDNALLEKDHIKYPLFKHKRSIGNLCF